MIASAKVNNTETEGTFIGIHADPDLRINSTGNRGSIESYTRVGCGCW